MSFRIQLPVSAQASDTLALADALSWYGVESQQLPYQEVEPKQLYVTSTGAIHTSIERLNEQLSARAALVASSWLATLGVPRAVRYDQQNNVFIIHRNS